MEVVVRIAAISAILFFLDWKLTLVSLVFVPFLVVRSSMVMVKMRDMWLHVQELMGQLVTILQENLSGIHVVTAFAAEEHEKKKYSSKAQELREDYFKIERLMGTNSAWVTLYFTLALGLIMWVGGWQVINGNMTPGDLTKFVLFMGQLVFPIRMSAFVIATFSRAISSGRRLFDVLDARSPVEERPDARDMGRALGHVRFENVSFSYDSDTPALKNVDIDIPPGSMVALLGAPGSGKSTIVNLLPRFYSVTSGKITIDGTNIEAVHHTKRRQDSGAAPGRGEGSGQPRRVAGKGWIIRPAARHQLRPGHQGQRDCFRGRWCGRGHSGRRQQLADFPKFWFGKTRVDCMIVIHQSTLVVCRG